jgi:hypothetical protein
MGKGGVVEASTVHRGSLKMERPVLDEREELHG